MVSRSALPRPKAKDYVPGVQESLQDAFPSTFLSCQGSKTKQSWFHHAFHHSGFARSRCPSIQIWDHWHGKWRFSATNLIRQKRCDNVHIFGHQKESWKTHDLSQSLAKAKDRRLSARASFFGPHTFQCRSFALCLGGKMPNYQNWMGRIAPKSKTWSENALFSSNSIQRNPCIGKRTEACQYQKQKTSSVSAKMHIGRI